jgi:predicted RNase H-like nuclease (RuvC/YqgF family)
VGRKEIMDFTPINTQEEFDSAIRERLTRERETAAKKYEGYVPKAEHEKSINDFQKQLDDLTAKYADSDKTIETLKAQVHKYETDSVKTKIAHEVGLPYGMASRISGESEDDIRKDAESLKALIGNG